jgi:hypothetical protein
VSFGTLANLRSQTHSGRSGTFVIPEPFCLNARGIAPNIDPPVTSRGWQHTRESAPKRRAYRSAGGPSSGTLPLRWTLPAELCVSRYTESFTGSPLPPPTLDWRDRSTATGQTPVASARTSAPRPTRPVPSPACCASAQTGSRSRVQRGARQKSGTMFAAAGPSLKLRSKQSK